MDAPHVQAFDVGVGWQLLVNRKKQRSDVASLVRGHVEQALEMVADGAKLGFCIETASEQSKLVADHVVF